MLPTMFSQTAPAERIEEFAVSMSEFHLAGFRAMARAGAEADLWEILRSTDVPTLLLYGDQDVPAPLRVGQDLHAAIPGSRLVVMPGIGHLSSLEAAERFNGEVRVLLHEPRR